jgi:DNA transformation protein
MSRKVSDLPNLGETSRKWLNDIGIFTEEDLRKTGAVQAYLKIKLREPRASLNLLWSLWGALENIPWNRIPPEVKEKLKNQVE